MGVEGSEKGGLSSGDIFFETGRNKEEVTKTKKERKKDGEEEEEEEVKR